MKGAMTHSTYFDFTERTGKLFPDVEVVTLAGANLGRYIDG
jgi:hypothetical protein